MRLNPEPSSVKKMWKWGARVMVEATSNELQMAKIFRKMEPWFWKMDRGPGQPMWMGCSVGTFIEISAPFRTGRGVGDVGVRIEDIVWKAVGHRPGQRIRYFLFDWPIE